jgi:phosphoglycerate dehydrogenase-like enzyme
MADRSLVIQTEDLDPEPAAWMAERCEFVVCPFEEDPRFGELLARAEGLVVRTYTQVNKALLARAPKLRVVGRAGVALENIDVAACRARGVEVVHAPEANTRAVVEYVSALLADATRPRMYMERAVPAGEWHHIRREFLGERELNEMTLGIWGFGRIGSAVARVAAAMNMRAIYNDLLEIPTGKRSGAEAVTVERLLAESDILTVHVDFRPQNKHLINAAGLATCKPDMLFINTSRGFVVDPAALAAWLRANPQAQAMVDVHDPFEPVTPDYPLLGVPNARVSPHLASGTVKAKRNMSWVVRDVWRVLSGEKPEFPAPKA